MAITLTGVPDWVEQGPGTILNGNNVEGIPDRPQAGAVNDLAPDPTDPDRLFVASTNGGVWRTTNATAANPTWTPLTDQFQSLAIGSIAFSPLDATNSTLFAGAGRFSSGFGDGGPRIGLLKTTDGGNTWALLGSNVLGGKNIEQVIPTSIGTPATQVVLVGTNQGVFRSADGGSTFGASAVLAGNITDLAADPGNNMRYYAAVPGQGVFLSTDGGMSFNPANGNISTANVVTPSTYVELAVHNNTGMGTNAVYAVFFDPPPPMGQNPTINVFRSTNQGGMWTPMDSPFAINGPRKASFVADQANANVVYIAGVPAVESSPKPFMCGRPSGRVFRADASQAAGSQWAAVVCNGANGTSPHPDARDMAIDADGNLLYTSDGGVYRLVNPDNAATRTWVSADGDIRTTEFYSVAYDSLNNASFGGTQDNGSPQQTDPGGSPGASPPTFTWFDRTGADGGIAQADNDQTAHPGLSIHYGSEQNLGCFTRQGFDATNTPIPNVGICSGSTNISVLVNGTAKVGMPGTENDLYGVETALPGGSTVQFIQPYVLNSVDPSRMIIGTNFLYESTDSGDHLTSLGGLMDLNSDGIDNDQDAMSMAASPPLHGTDEGDEFKPTNPLGAVNPTSVFPSINPVAYGGRAGGVANLDVLWVGAGGNLFLRTTGSGLPTQVTNYNGPGGAGGTTINDIVLDPADWHIAYILDRNGNVFKAVTDDAGSSVTFTKLTGNLAQFTTDLRTIQFVRNGGSTPVLLVGGQAGVYAAINPDPPIWFEVGANLPNAIAQDLVYDSTDDLLLVGTYGRGAWTIANASTVLTVPGVLNVCGDEDYVNQDDQFVLNRDTANPALLDVFINGVLEFTGPIAAIFQINVFGVGGNDNLIVDSSNGLINVPSGIRYDGDGTCPDEQPGFGYDRGFDKLTLDQTGGDTQTGDTYSVGATNGSGTSVITGPSGTQTVFFEELEPVIDTVPAVNLTVNATPESNAINYGDGVVTPGANGRVTVDNYESIEFSNKTTLTINALAGSDEINLANPNTPMGLTGDCDGNAGNGNQPICIDGGDPGGSDTVVVTGTSAAETFEYRPDGPDSGQLLIPGADVNFDAAEAVVVAGRSDLNDDTLIVRTQAGVDSVTLVPGGNVDAGTIHINSSAGTESAPSLTFRSLGQDSFIQLLSGSGAGTREDIFEYRGTDTADTFGVSAANGGTITLNNRKEVRVPGASALVLRGLAGDDALNIAAGTAFTNITVDGGEPGGSDLVSLSGTTGAEAIVVNLEPGTITGFGPTVSLLGVEGVSLAGGGGVGVDTLTVNGTSLDDELTYRPTGAAAGIFSNRTSGDAEEPAPVFTFSAITGTFTVAGGTASADEVVVEGTNTRDTITINATNRTTNTVQVNVLKAVALATDTEIVRVLGRDGNDTFVVNPAPGVGGSLDNLLVYVDGGAPGASDALVVQDADGTALDASDFAVVNRGRQPNEGVVRVFRDTPGAGNEPTQLPDISYTDIEVVSPNVFVNAAGDPNLLILGPDLNEPNEFRANAAFLGAGATLQIEHASLFPNANEHPFVPADNDFYRVVAKVTGTLDFQVYFREVPELLPGAGNIEIQVQDLDGTVLAGFGVNDVLDNERVRIPAVAGQTYYLRVFGANDNVVNAYDVTVINEASPLPYDLELADAVNAAYACPETGLGEDPSSDTGRSQFDNVTCNPTPTIRLRLDDAFFLHDLPGNPADDTPPDEVIPIPFQGLAGAAGFRVAIFDEGAPQQPGGLPQVPVGFATFEGDTNNNGVVDGGETVVEGVYKFTFPAALSDGSHFLSARVQMVDPATPQQSGFGGRSVSLEIVVDTAPPPVFFGTAGDPSDGLEPASDSGVVGNSASFTDRITSVTTPTFFGTAEANAVIRLFVDSNNNGVFNPGVDLEIAETVAVPLDGTNQFPNGSWSAQSELDLNDPTRLPLLPHDGRRRLFVTAEDLAGNVNPGAGVLVQQLDIFLDTQGPQVTNVQITGSPGFNLFGLKPANRAQGPTPLVNSLTISLQDLPVEDALFLRAAIEAGVAGTPGLYVLRGDHVGIVRIEQIIVTNDPPVPGLPASASIQLVFSGPLPDDRYTLSIDETLVDLAGNALNGESNAAEPNGAPLFPSGDLQPGGDFVARFTVDSRPEIGTFCCGSWYIDLNGNGVFDDPNNPHTDATNADIVFHFGSSADHPVVGDWNGDGFDEIGVYGVRTGGIKFELDVNGNGAFNAGTDAEFVFGNVVGRPISGDWNLDGVDDVALFDGTTWFVDLNGNRALDAGETIPTNMRGLPISGDWTGTGIDRVGTFRDDTFFLDLNGDFQFDAGDALVHFGFHTPKQIPVAGDFDGDGDTEIGLFVQDRNGQFPREAAEWYLDQNLSAELAAGVVNAAGILEATALFEPPPTGSTTLPLVNQDLFYQFGDELSEPVLGNFDPPVGRPAVDRHANRRGAGATPLVWDGTGQLMSRSGAIEAVSDKDWFRFTATQTGRIALDLTTPRSGLDAALKVVDGSGIRLARNNNFGIGTDSHVEIDVVAGGTYYVLARGARGTIGSYELGVSYAASSGAPSGHAGSLALGALGATVADGVLAAAGASDVYRFTAGVGGRLEFRVAAGSGGFDSVVDVFDAQGRVVAHNDNAAGGTTDSRVTLDVRAGETYTLRVRAQGGRIGGYELTVDWLLENGI